MKRIGALPWQTSVAHSGVAALLILGLLSSVAHAEDPTRAADDLFHAATAAYQRGEYSAAARAFDEAQRRAPRAETSYNAGIAWEAAGDLLRAANAFRVALATGPLPERLESDARARHARLAAPFAELDIDGPPSATVEISGVLRDHPPIATYIEPGSYRVSIEYALGKPESRSIVLEKGRKSSLIFREPPAPQPSAPKAAPTAASTSWQLVMGITALGAAGIGAGTGLALGARGLTARDRFNESGHTDAGARDQALSLRTDADIAFGAALACSAVGVVLLLERPHNPATAATLRIGPGSLTFGSRF